MARIRQHFFTDAVHMTLEEVRAEYRKMVVAYYGNAHTLYDELKELKKRQSEPTSAAEKADLDEKINEKAEEKSIAEKKGGEALIESGQYVAFQQLQNWVILLKRERESKHEGDYTPPCVKNVTPSPAKKR